MSQQAGMLQRLLDRIGPDYRTVDGNRVRLLHDGDRCFDEMLSAIDSAKREILLEMYWFESDTIGWRFAGALSERAKEGLRVQVIYDSIGSLGADEAMFESMRSAGCEVIEYNPLAPWKRRFHLPTINDRDHRKMLILDEQVGFTGGVNIADPWLNESSGGQGWRDDMVMIEGPAAGLMRTLFLRNWTRLHGGEPEKPKPSPQTKPSERLCGIRVLDNHFGLQRFAIRQEYLQQIDRAERYIYVSNSYFVPDIRVRRALERAAKRGVRVCVLTPARSDVPAVYHASRYLYARLLRVGIRIFEWQHTILHAKTAVVDDQWCTIGTYNLDYRSWRSNLEINVAIEDASVAAAMRERFEQDSALSAEIDLRQWRSRSVAERLLGAFFYTFRKLL